MTFVARRTSEHVHLGCLVHHETAWAFERAAERAGLTKGDALREAFADYIKKQESKR